MGVMGRYVRASIEYQGRRLKPRSLVQCAVAVAVAVVIMVICNSFSGGIWVCGGIRWNLAQVVHSAMLTEYYHQHSHNSIHSILQGGFNIQLHRFFSQVAGGAPPPKKKQTNNQTQQIHRLNCETALWPFWTWTCGCVISYTQGECQEIHTNELVTRFSFDLS
jgi:hypothetical protein